jgi:hypothetical protein
VDARPVLGVQHLRKALLDNLSAAEPREGQARRVRLVTSADYDLDDQDEDLDEDEDDFDEDDEDPDEEDEEDDDVETWQVS